MKKNKTLHFANLFLKFFMLFYMLMFLVFIAVVIYWHFVPGDFGNVDVTSGFRSGVGVFKLEFSADNMPPKAIVLSSISYPMMYWLVLRNSIFFVVTFFILKKLRSVVTSVNEQNSFYEDNIGHFAFISKACLIIAVVGSFNFYYQFDKITFDFTLPLTWLLFAALGFVLSEIFKEGYLLTEDKNSIV